MVLSIKNRQAEQLAQELPELVGESTSTAVTEALRERLDRVRSEQTDGLVERLLQIGKDCAAHLKPPIGRLTIANCYMTSRGCHDDSSISGEYLWIYADFSGTR